MNNLSFSIDENRVQYFYIPECIQYITGTTSDNLNLATNLSKSISSSNFFVPNLDLSINSSFSNHFGTSISHSLDLGKEHQIVVDKNMIAVHQKPQIIELGLDYLVPNQKMKTKNVLRNFGNAQNQYMLHNRIVMSELRDFLEHPQEFNIWIRKLKLLNFEDYTNIWTIQKSDSSKTKYFKKVYRHYCWRFYEEECIPYIFNSRLTNISKKTHLIQIHRMLMKTINPEKVDRFKI